MKRIKLISSGLAACALLVRAGDVRAQDRPQWRGPNRDGKATGFQAPGNWPQELKQIWTAQVGVGDSTPALVNGRLYTLGREDTDEVIRCFDATTGKTVWEQRYPADYIVTGPPARHPGTRSSPAVADGKVCTLGVGGILSCLDAETGKVLWRKQSVNDYLGTAYRYDSSMSPLLTDGLCIAHVGGKGAGSIFAFDLGSGAVKWKWDGDAPAASSPVVMTVNGAKLLVTITAKSLLALDLSNGRLLWQIPFEAKQGNNTTPVVDGETLYYTGQGKGLFALKVEPRDGGFAATPLWTNSTLGARFTTPVLKDGLLYGYVRGFSCADAKTGETVWSDATGRGMSAALVDAGPVLVASTVDSGIIVFRPGGKEYDELAKLRVADSETWATPVLSGKHIFVRDHETVTCWSVD
jgi:outer membrane protein assembly factor BamB